MATYKHPITGVELNIIDIDRASLDEVEAVTVHILNFEGHDQDAIASRFGTNQARISDVLKGRTHTGAAERAAQMMRDNGALLI